MMTSQHNRILATPYSAHGLGYAVLEKTRGLIVFGNRRIRGNKNAVALAQVESWIKRYQPDVIVLPKVNTPGARHSVRIRRLHRSMLALAKRKGMNAVEVAPSTLKTCILGRPVGTKQQLFEAIAQRFPAELGSRIPRPRKLWTSEDSRAGAFEAIALGLSVLESQYGLPGELPQGVTRDRHLTRAVAR